MDQGAGCGVAQAQEAVGGWRRLQAAPPPPDRKAGVGGAVRRGRDLRALRGPEGGAGPAEGRSQGALERRGSGAAVWLV